MTQYARRTYHYDEDGFETDDEIVEVLHHNSQKSRITALVIPDQDVPTTFEKGAGESLPKKTFFCTAKKDSGGRCSREVDEPGDSCWQHPNEEE